MMKRNECLSISVWWVGQYIQYLLALHLVASLTLKVTYLCIGGIEQIICYRYWLIGVYVLGITMFVLLCDLSPFARLVMFVLIFLLFAGL
jgi:hypothetical protein